MNQSSISFIVILALLLSAGTAQAQRRGLFLLQNLQQGISFDYNYDGQSTESGRYSSSSGQHFFEEKYNVGLDYALFDSRIMKGHLSTDLRLSQGLADVGGGSQSSSEKGIEYAISGVALERGAFPLNFSSVSQITNVHTAFTQPYTLKTDSNYVGISLKNRLLPTSVSYTVTTNETTGLAVNRGQDSQLFLLESKHINKASSTDFTLNSSIDRSHLVGVEDPPEGRHYSLQLHNNLLLGDREKGRSLDSTVHLEQSLNFVADKALNVVEVLTVPLGKALLSGADFSLLDRDVHLVNQPSNKSTSQAGHLYLQHQLFESLTTRLDLNAREDVNAGKEQNLGGGLSVAYKRQLTVSSVLNLLYAGQYQVLDRNVVSANAQVFDERHLVAGLLGSATVPDQIQLANPEVLAASIIVRNADPVKAPTPYLVDTDYQVVQVGGVTSIRILSPQILIGDALLVSYTYAINPQVKYSTISQRSSAALAWGEGKYRLIGSWDRMRQDLISGRAEVVSLSGGDIYRMAFEGNLDAFRFGSDMEYYDTDQDRHEAYGGTCNYRHGSSFGVYSLNVGDRYIINRANAQSGVPVDRSINSMSAGGSLSRALFGTLQMTLNSNYSQSRGDGLLSENVSLGFNLRWYVGRLTMVLVAQEDWRDASGTLARNDHVQFRLQRTF